MAIEIRDYQVPVCLRIDRKKGKVTGELRAISFPDNGYQILYCPELNLSAYGDNQKEALEMLQIVFDDFSEGLLKLSVKEMNKELSNYGFYPQSFKKNFKFTGAFIDNKGVLREFNLPEDTPVETKELAVS